MKYIKLFEELNEPQIGDYVVCDVDEDEVDLYNFLQNHIGCIDRSYQGEKEFDYYVKFTEEINTKDEVAFKKDEIIFWSKNIEDCEIFLNAKKYNL